MASAGIWTFERDDIRLTVRASTIDVVLYVNWVAETIRERKVRRQFLFATWDEWQREGDPIPIGAFYQLAPGTIPPPGMGNPMGPFTSSPTGSPGYRNVGLYQVALSMSFTEGANPSVGAASGLVRSVDGMTVSFTHEGKVESFSIGANQVMYLIAKLVIFLTLLVVFAIVAWLVYGAV